MSEQTPVWVVPEADAAEAEALAVALEIPVPFARLLVSRGHSTTEEARAFLAPELDMLPSPLETFPGCTEAVARIWKAIDAEERITIFADYDVDGVSAAAMVLEILRDLGGKVEVFFPCRQADGYGLRLPGLTRCLEETEPQLILTLDCGTGGAEAVAEAAKLVAATVKALAFGKPYPIALAGGVVCRNQLFRDELMVSLNGLEVPPSEVTLVEEPVMGCLEIARTRLGIIDSSRTGRPA